MGNRNSGRRPQPTALKILRGNPGQGQLNDAEPQPPSGPVGKPAMSAAAAVVWDDLAPVAMAMGTLTTADVRAFVTLCELQATFTVACEEKGRDGFSPFLVTTMVDSAGNEHVNVKEHPAIGLERKTAAALKPYYEKFGLEPSGRARIRVPAALRPESKWDEILDAESA